MQDQTAAWVEVRRFRSEREAQQYALVLVAAGISAVLAADLQGVGLRVSAEDAARAFYELGAYDRENRRPALLPDRTNGRALSDGLTGALAVAAALVFTFAAEMNFAFGRDWLAAGVGQVGLIADGEWWRVFTALGLHADLGHLAGNLAAGLLFGLLLSQLLGSGLTWLSVLLAGGLGNALNAAAQSATHSTIGASTGVFAALGILAVLMLSGEHVTWRRGLRRWAPLAGGIMLLVMLGTSGERTDIGAHFAGFVVGAGFGAVLSLVGSRIPQGARAQAAYGATAFGLFTIVWLIALGTGPPASSLGAVLP